MENQSNPRPLLMESLCQWLWEQFRISRVPLLSSLIWGLLAYLFAFTNKLVNHDDVHDLFSKGSTSEIGRWGLDIVDRIFPNYSMPWIYGFLTVFFIAIGICLIVRIFRIESKPVQVLLSGCVMVFPSVIGLFGYMFTSSSYGLSFLLCIVSVWMVTRRSRRWLLPAAVCLIFSLSLYQAYIAIAVSLLVLVCIQALVWDEDPVSVWKLGVGFVVFLLVSLLLYYGLTLVLLHWKGRSFGEYAEGSTSLSLSGVLSGIRLAYITFLRFFYWAHHRLLPTSLSRHLHFYLLGLILLLLLLLVTPLKKKRAQRFGLLAVLVAILPLAINFMYMISPEGAIHTLVLYSFSSIYVFAAFLMDRALTCGTFRRFAEMLRRFSVNAMAGMMAVILAINIYVANESYLNMYLRYENTYAFYTSLIADIKAMPEFTPGTKLALIGQWQSPQFYDQHFETTYYLMGVAGFMPTEYSRQDYLNYYIGFPMEFASWEEMVAIQETEAFQQMPTYPYYGSLDVINDTIVVKLSE